MAVRCGIKILFIILFLLGGCATTMHPVKKKPSAKKELLADVVVFKDLQQIDLDKDGDREIVALYATGSNSTGVRVIKINKQKGKRIIFDQIFNTPDVKFKLKNDTPSIVVRQPEYLAGCGLTKIYHWDGRAFVA